MLQQGRLYIVVLLALSQMAFASSSHFQTSFSVGPAWYQVKNANIIVSSYETDKNITQITASTPQYRLGVGYYIPNNLRFISNVLFELNWYHSEDVIKGVVWQSGETIFNNYAFYAPFITNRLMLDIKPCLFSFHHFLPYPIFGIGTAWSKTKYYEQTIGSGIDQDSALNLSAQTNAILSFDIGLGFKYEFTEHFGATVEYIYTYLHSLKPSLRSASTASSAIIARQPTFSADVQSLMLGLTWKF